MGQVLRAAVCAAAALATAGVPAAKSRAEACVCCADEGVWEQANQEPSAFERHELERLRFAVETRLSAGVHGLARGVRGAAPLAERYRVSVVRGERQWTLQLEDAAGRIGALVLYLPRAWTLFRVDPGDGLMVREGEPSLYKEVRLEGPVDGEGIVAPDATPRARYRLILRGRGNACFNASDFASWILQLEGPDPDHPAARVVYYALIGRFDPIED